MPGSAGRWGHEAKCAHPGFQMEARRRWKWGRRRPPGAGTASGASVPPSHLGAHERGAELGCETPRRGRIPAPPRASDFGLTYRRGQVSRSSCCSKEKGHFLARLQEGREPGSTAKGCGGAGGGGGKREGRVGAPRRRQQLTWRMRACGRRAAAGSWVSWLSVQAPPLTLKPGREKPGVPLSCRPAPHRSNVFPAGYSPPDCPASPWCWTERTI